MTRFSIRRRPVVIAAWLLPAVLLSGCDWISRSSSETTMRNVEILPGTASDEMITLDQASGDGTSLDTSSAANPAAPAAAAAAEGENDDDAPAAGAGAETSNDGDVVIRPPGE